MLVGKKPLRSKSGRGTPVRPVHACAGGGGGVATLRGCGVFPAVASIVLMIAGKMKPFIVRDEKKKKKKEKQLRKSGFLHGLPAGHAN